MLQLKVGTWNVDRSGVRGKSRWIRQLQEMQRVDADVWVLSETHRDHVIPEMHGCFSAPGEPPYARLEAAVAVWSRWPSRPVEVSNPRLSTAVELQIPESGLQLLVYATIIPYQSDGKQQGHAAWSLHRQAVDALMADCSRLRSQYPGHCFILAGDFNMSLGPKAWYGLQDVKTKLMSGLDRLQIDCCTLDDPRDRNIPRGNVDHIFATHDLVPGEAVDFWFDRSLSDHNGVAIKATLISKGYMERLEDWEPEIRYPQCHSCVHWRGDLTCDAYPEGVPAGILSNELSHLEPLPGDGGITYVARPESLDGPAGLIGVDPSRAITSALAFEDRPHRWGLCGDPCLWEEMARLVDLPTRASLQQVHAHLLGLFAGLTGGSLDADEPIRVDRYETGGLSEGWVSPAFWREEAIPLLLGRYTEGQPLSIMCWNVNHRTGRTTYYPEAAGAAMATGADVLVFTEFFPQHRLERFTSQLHEGGWVHQALSSNAGVRANQVLVASRRPIVVRELPPSAVDQHLVANTLRLQVDGCLELLCARMPTYTGSQRSAAWDWLTAVANDARQRGKAMLIGDLNTGLLAATPMPQFLSLCATWNRLQPTGRGSFFGKSGNVSEIDHALTSGATDGTAWYVRRAGEFCLAGSDDALSDHAGLFVQLDLG